MSSNTCECPKPPGGKVVCGPNHFAVCRVEDGQVHSECHEIPKPITEAISAFHPGYYPELLLTRAILASWVHNVVTRGRPGIMSFSETGGQFVSEQYNIRVSFTFPLNWRGLVLSDGLEL